MQFRYPQPNNGSAGHWRAQGAVNAPRKLWPFNSVPTRQAALVIKAARGVVTSRNRIVTGAPLQFAQEANLVKAPRRRRGEVGSKPTLGTNSSNQ